LPFACWALFFALSVVAMVGPSLWNGRGANAFGQNDRCHFKLSAVMGNGLFGGRHHAVAGPFHLGDHVSWTRNGLVSQAS
jgi:hypothetical protein